MKFEECLRDFDKLEEKRKADYSIWGYLYQFDLAFYDMLCQYQTKDLFDKFNDIKNPTYEIETIEDYSKYYSCNGVNYLNLAQVKYSSVADDFTYWDVLIGLYYNYLYIKHNCDEDINISCSVFFSTPNKVDIKKEDIITTALKVMDEYLKEIEKKEIDILNVEIESLGSFEKRKEYLIKKYYNKEDYSEFIKNNLIIKWFYDKENIKKHIKIKLVEIFGEKFQSLDMSQNQDILYSLGINYLINTWQDKKKRSEIKLLNIDELKDYYDLIDSKRDDLFNNMIIDYIRGTIDEELQHIKRRLLLKGYSDGEVDNEIKISFVKNADNLYKYFIELFKNKENRYKLLNTIALKTIISKEEYLSLDIMNELKILSESQTYFKSYIQRLLNIMYYNDKNGFQCDNELQRLLCSENDMILINLSNEKRNAILFPKAHQDVLDSHEIIFKRMMNTKVRPSVWYFDNDEDLSNKGIYEFKINRIIDNDVNISRPYNSIYYIECMKCLKENDFLNICDINCIFQERCKKDGNNKY